MMKRKKQFTMIPTDLISDWRFNNGRPTNAVFSKYGDENPQPIDGVEVSWNYNVMRVYLALNEGRYQHNPIHWDVELLSIESGINDVTKTKKALLNLVLLGHCVIKLPFTWDEKLTMQLTSYREYTGDSPWMELTHIQSHDWQRWNNYFKTDILDKFQGLSQTSKKEEKVSSKITSFEEDVLSTKEKEFDALFNPKDGDVVIKKDGGWEDEFKKELEITAGTISPINERNKMNGQTNSQRNRVA